MAVLPVVSIAVWLFVVMAVAWLVQRRTGSSGWIDTIWSLGVGAGGILAALIPSGLLPGGRRILVILLIGAWALRLGGHIARRTMGSGEDPRYAALKEEWGLSFPSRLFLFLQIQAFAAFVLVLAVYAAATNPAPFPRLFDIIAILIAVVAICGEGLADSQLAAFKKNSRDRGDVCEAGLWRWSRHPNYFFEWLFWCAWPFLAISFSGDHPWGWIALSAPILMYLLLVHISGIPPLEAHMLESRGEAFRELQFRVRAFFPGPRHERNDGTRT